MNLTLSKRDKKLLLILAGVALIALSYFVVYRPAADRAESRKVENEQLEIQLTRLIELASEQPQYETEIAQYEKEIKNLTAEFPADTLEEDAIFFGHNMETQQGKELTISAITMGNPEVVLVTSVGGTATSDTADTATVEGGVSSTVSEYTMFRTLNGYVYDASYSGLKAYIKAINEQNDKMTIHSLNASFNSESGRLTGTIQTNFFTMAGTERTYSAPNLPSVSRRTNDLFGTAR